jgi:hypothetical protein
MYEVLQESSTNCGPKMGRSKHGPGVLKKFKTIVGSNCFNFCLCQRNPSHWYQDTETPLGRGKVASELALWSIAWLTLKRLLNAVSKRQMDKLQPVYHYSYSYLCCTTVSCLNNPCFTSALLSPPLSYPFNFLRETPTLMVWKLNVPSKIFQDAFKRTVARILF